MNSSTTSQEVLTEQFQILDNSEPINLSLKQRIISILQWIWHDRRSKYILALGLASVVIALILFLHREQVISALTLLRDHSKEYKTTTVMLIISLLVIVSFPPFVGYSAILMTSGFLYGTGEGFVINFCGGFLGSQACFLLSRFLLRRGNNVTTSTNTRERSTVNNSIGLKLHKYLTRHPDQIWKMVLLLRLGAFPYNYTSFTLGQVEAVSWRAYTVISGIVLSKTAIHAFIGSTLSDLSQVVGGGKPSGSHWIEIVVVCIGAIFMVISGYYVYRIVAYALAEADDDEEVDILQV